ncbi:hypothetical protein Francci3_2107 [Frankia casuarinae]|uniref:Uncharacterized protein n=1 Tax=Frankia casuarinae (strain DSM 45818 / CECT 9043 / HFP020203 / CcI3) TaxID=106370 RepID=Q2JB63_FRACC|nr:hypothetical protein Francci3_2107 [Frankia casuarinae]
MSTGSVQPSLFDDLDDSGSGPAELGGQVAGPETSTEGADCSSSLLTDTAGERSCETTVAWVGGWAAPRPALARGGLRDIGADRVMSCESETDGGRGPGAAGRRRGRSSGRSVSRSAAGPPDAGREAELEADARWIAAQLARAPEPSALMAAAIVTALAPKPARNVDSGGQAGPG